MTEEQLSALKKCELFEGIDAQQLKTLLSCLKPQVQVYTRNEFVVRSGESLESLGIVLEGEASVIKETIKGDRLLLKNLSAGEMFGEIAAFARQKEWPALVKANTPLTICFLPRDKIIGQCSNLCQWHHAMVTNMLCLISRRALVLSRKMEYLSIKTMRAKLATFIYEHYLKKQTLTFLIPMNRAQLADFLNVSRPSMSRELSRMRNEGLIDFHMSTFKVINLEGLKAYCE